MTQTKSGPSGTLKMFGQTMRDPAFIIGVVIATTVMAWIMFSLYPQGAQDVEAVALISGVGPVLLLMGSVMGWAVGSVVVWPRPVRYINLFWAGLLILICLESISIYMGYISKTNIS